MMPKNEKIKSGYWSIATQKHLKRFRVDATGIQKYDTLNSAGKCGRLLGVLRGNKVIDNYEKVLQMANDVGISQLELERIILPDIEKASDQRVKVIKDHTGDIKGIEEYVFTNSDVLEISGQVFDNLGPKSVELVTIDTLDETKKIPYIEAELTEMLTGKGFKEEDIVLAYALQKQFKLIQSYGKTKSKDNIIANEYVWGSNSRKIAMAVSDIDLNGRQNLKNIIEEIHQYQGYPLEKMPKENFELLTMAKKIGMIDPTTIVSSRGITKDFGFSSNLLGLSSYEDDILDDVKLLLASIRFGENYTQYSTISEPAKFLKKLIDDGDIGPHSANLTDYTLLEKKGIVRVVNKTKSGFYGNRTGACLELIRKDVAEEALKIITEPDYNLQSDIDITDFGSMIDTSSYTSPEESRMQIGESPANIKEVEEYALMRLRGELLD